MADPTDIKQITSEYPFPAEVDPNLAADRLQETCNMSPCPLCVLPADTRAHAIYRSFSRRNQISWKYFHSMLPTPGPVCACGLPRSKIFEGGALVRADQSAFPSTFYHAACVPLQTFFCASVAVRKWSFVWRWGRLCWDFWSCFLALGQRKDQWLRIWWVSSMMHG